MYIQDNFNIQHCYYNANCNDTVRCNALIHNVSTSSTTITTRTTCMKWFNVRTGCQKNLLSKCCSSHMVHPLSHQQRATLSTGLGQTCVWKLYFWSFLGPAALNFGFLGFSSILKVIFFGTPCCSTMYCTVLLAEILTTTKLGVVVILSCATSTRSKISQMSVLRSRGHQSLKHRILVGQRGRILEDTTGYQRLE